MRSCSWLNLYSAAFMLAGLALPALTLIAFRLPAASPGGHVWSGYVTLAVESALPAEEVTAALQEAGVQEVISYSTAEIRYNDIDRLASVPLSRLDQRFLEYDPRVDPYMRSLRSFFFAVDGEREYALFYLNSAEGRGRIPQIVERALGERDVEWRIADATTADARFGAVLFAIAAGLVLLRLRSVWPPLLLGGGVIAMQLSRAGVGVLFPVSVSFFLWAYLVAELARYLPHRLNHRPTVPPPTYWTLRLAFAAPVVAAAMLYAYRIEDGNGAVLHLIVALGVFASLTTAELTRAVMKHRRRDHRLFVPVSLRPQALYRRHSGLKRRRSGLQRLRSIALPAAIAATLAATWVPAWLPADDSLPVPAPVEIQGADNLSYDALAKLEQSRAPHGLPDLALYLSHRAYQETFMHGREFRFPERDEELTQPRFLREEGRIARTDEVRMRFDAEWREAVWSDIPSGSPMRLLLAEGRAVGVELASSPALYSARSTVLRHGLLLAAAFVLFLVALSFGGQSLGEARDNVLGFAGRKTSQEA